MKKVLMTMLVVAAVAGCSSSPYGQGGENARQFVKEQVHGLRDDIAKVEVIWTDTVAVYDLPRLAEELRTKENDADLNIISCKELREYVDSIKRLWQDRVLYRVEVTMKSSRSEKVDVIMEADGTTPYILRDDYDKIEKPFHMDMMADEVMVCDSDIEGN